MKFSVRLAVLAAALLLAGGGLFFLWHTGFFSAASLEGMRAYLSGFAPAGQVMLFLIQLLSVVVAPIPSNLTALAGAAVFGTWSAFWITTGAVVAGSVLVFWLARVLGRPFAERLVGSQVSGRYWALLHRKRDVFLALAFLFPFFPDDLLCILAGLTDLSLPRFTLLVTLTRPWGLLAACALGGSALSLPLWALAALGAAGVLLFAACLRYGDLWEERLLRRFRQHI